MEVQVIDGPRLQRSEIPTVVGAITVGELMGRYEIPKWNGTTEKGYQREPVMSRVRDLAYEIRKAGVDLPTAILVNRRDIKPGELRAQDELKFIPLSREQNPQQSFYIVDGQHRVRALEILFEEDSVKWSNYQIPFVCMIGADEEQELEQFYVVNSNAKSVKTDLAFELLRKQADKNADFANAIEGTRKGYQVKGQRLVNELRKISPVWKGRIQHPNEPKHNATIRSGAMVSSLQDALKQIIFSSFPLEQQAKILDAYWQGIRIVYSEAFEDDNPHSYNLQKTTGVNVLHIVFPYALQLASQQSGMQDKQVYANIMRNSLERLELLDGNGELTYGLDCWRVGKSGATGNYGNKAGNALVAEKIRQYLPEPRTEYPTA